jgi:hypothetical protein
MKVNLEGHDLVGTCEQCDVNALGAGHGRDGMGVAPWLGSGCRVLGMVTAGGQHPATGMSLLAMEVSVGWAGGAPPGWGGVGH